MEKHIFWHFCRHEERKTHFYDGMAKQRMVILQHNQSLVSYWGRPLQLWYVKKAEQTPSNIQGQSENFPPTINVYSGNPSV